MESKSLLFLFALIIAIPAFAISSNHEVFFAVASLVVMGTSIRNLYKLAVADSFENEEPDDETISELEDLINIDVRKFGTGISVFYNLFIILLLFYSVFYLDAIFMKVICALAITLQVHFIIKKAGKNCSSYKPDRQRVQIFISSISNIAVIIFALLNKLARLR